MGIVICENILRHLDDAPPEADRLMVIHRAASEVGGAVLTAVSTTVVSFLPVFTMIGAEGKLFKPLAFTKTFALIASVIVALTIIPPAAHLLFCTRTSLTGKKIRHILHLLLVLIGVSAGFLLNWWAGVALILFGIYYLTKDYIPDNILRFAPWVANLLAVLFVGLVLSEHWEPIGPERGFMRNFIFVGGLVAGLLTFFRVFQHFYPSILRWCLAHKLLFLSIPCLLLLLGGSVWLGFDTIC
jgi:Cu(I)/Ag(I) efflux system membrane protein CusA/SilA